MDPRDNFANGLGRPDSPTYTVETESVSSVRTAGSNEGLQNPHVATYTVGLLDQKYAEVRRRQLQVINKLQSLGTALDFDIPQIVVIGSQSVGKSSLIESISGITLPRARGTCTRCPTECRLINSSEPWVCKVFIRYLTDEHGQRLERVKEDSFGSPIHNPLEVEARIRGAQRAALNPGGDASRFLHAGDPAQPFKDAMDFTINCVSLEIRGPNLTDLSFCDLPGLIASVSDGGNPEDIKKVEELVSSYIAKPSCIILLTVGCETDFETQGAYQLAKQYDKDGTRTVGVLTKPDRIENLDGVYDWIRLIKNERSKLQHGWFCVKHPSGEELKMRPTFEEARQLGEDFFKNHPWSLLEGVYKRQLGTGNLTRSLNEHLLNLIEKRFPELLEELETRLAETKAEWDALPAPPSQNPILEIMNIIGEFINEVFRHGEGFIYDFSIAANQESTDNHFERLRRVYGEFHSTIEQTAPSFKPFNNANEVRQLSPPAVRVSRPQVWYEPENPPPPPTQEQVKYPPEAPNSKKDPVYLEDIEREVQRATTRELPGHCPFAVVKKLIRNFTSEWETPARVLIEAVYHIVLKHNCDLVEKHFGKFTSGGLQQRVMRIVQEFTQKRRDKATERVKWVLELESDPFTVNSMDLDHYMQIYLKGFKAERARFNLGDPNRYALEVMATTRGYFNVSYKRIADNVPLAIDRELVRLDTKGLQEMIVLGLRVAAPDALERCTQFFAEPFDVTEKRKELSNKLIRLREAQAELFSASR